MWAFSFLKQCLPVGQEIELDAKVVVELAQSKACF